MAEIIVKTEESELVWKDRDGNLIPVSKLSNVDLLNAINTAEKQIEKYSSLTSKFEELCKHLKKEGIARIKEAEKKQLVF